MMRAMRVIHKPLFVAVTFIGWLAYGQVTDILGGGRDVVLKVNGQIVRATQFQAALQNAIEESRRRGGGRLSREDEQQLQDQVTDQFIQRILLEREYRRLGIQVSDDEIRQMARSTPPPTRTHSSVRRRPGSVSSRSRKCQMPPTQPRRSPERGGCGRRSRAARRSSRTSLRRSRSTRSPVRVAVISAG